MNSFRATSCIKCICASFAERRSRLTTDQLAWENVAGNSRVKSYRVQPLPQRAGNNPPSQTPQFILIKQKYQIHEAAFPRNFPRTFFFVCVSTARATKSRFKSHMCPGSRNNNDDDAEEEVEEEEEEGQEMIQYHRGKGGAGRFI